MKKIIVFQLVMALILCFANDDLLAKQTTSDSLLIELNQLRANTPDYKKTERYIDILNELAHVYKYRTTDSVRIFSEEALNLSKSLDYGSGYALANLRMGDYHSETGKETEAAIYYDIALEQAMIIENPPILVEVLKSKAMRAFLNLDLTEAVLTYYKAIDRARNNNLLEAEAELRHNLAYLFYKFDLYNEAQLEYLVADSLWNVQRNFFKKAITSSNMALNAIANEDFYTVKKYLNESIATIEKNDAQPIWLSRAYRAKSKYYFKIDSLYKSLIWAKKSDSLLSNLFNKREQLDIDLLYSNIYTAVKKPSEAEKYTARTKTYAENLKDSTVLSQAFINLSLIEEQKGNLNDAYIYLKKGELIKSNLDRINLTQQLSVLRAKKNFENDKAAIVQASEEKINRQRLYAQLSILGLIFATIIAVIVVQTNKKEKKLNKKLTIQTEKLEKNKAELKTINKNQDKLFSIVGHDLRGPIVSLKELLTLSLENDEGQQYFYKFGPKLKNDVDQIYFTLDNLLNWGLTQMQGEPLNPSRINVKVELDHILHLFKEPLNKKTIDICNEIGSNCYITIDSNHFNIIFRNLISNAIKFTPKNGQIWLKSIRKLETLIIQVKDSGVGMSKEEINLVLNQSEYHTTFGTNNEPGTGLGLMLCKEMIRKNNGDIHIESLPEKGSTFSLRFPITS